MYSAIFSYPVYSSPPRDATQSARMSGVSMEKKAPRSRESSQLSRSSSQNTRGSGHHERSLQPPSESHNRLAKLLNKHRNRHRIEEIPINIADQRYSKSGQEPKEETKRGSLAPPSVSGNMPVAECEAGLKAATSKDAAASNGFPLLHCTEAPMVLGGERGEVSKAHVQHSRGHSLHVNWTPKDVERMAREICDETIADVHLSLFGYWIREQPENYDVAKAYIRELSLDQVSVQPTRTCCMLALLIRSCRATMLRGLPMSICASF